MQDFAGSTAVHMIGATGALAVLLLLGPRRGKYGADGKPRAIPGHNMPLFGLGVLILWLGWFGFNPGSTLNAQDGRFAEILIVTQLAAAAGVLTAIVTAALEDEVRSTSAWPATARSARSWPSPRRRATSSCGRRRSSAASPASSSRSRSTRSTRSIDDPVGALSAHGIAGIWGTLACGFFTVAAAGAVQRVRRPRRRPVLLGHARRSWGIRRSASSSSFAFVFALSFLTFWVIKKTYGLRVTAEEEEAGLDISEHGMYGYPEQFIPAPELVGYSGPRVA